MTCPGMTLNSLWLGLVVRAPASHVEVAGSSPGQVVGIDGTFAGVSTSKIVSIETECNNNPHERFVGSLVLDWEGCKSLKMYCIVL